MDKPLRFRVLLPVLAGLATWTPCALEAQLNMVKIAELPENMFETSGVVLYDDGHLLTHNDGGNKSELFVLDLKGNHLKTIDIAGVENEDWEDIAQDDEGRVYIGDFGNNMNNRESCQVYIVEDGFMDEDEVTAKKISFTYEDQEKFPPSEKNMNFDCEAFFWKNDTLYFFTKCRTKPFTGITTIYSVPAKAGKYKAEKIGVIQLCSTNWQFCSVTSVDYSAKWNTIALLTYSRLYLISDFSGIKFWEGKMAEYSLPVLRQREAICFRGKNAWYMTDEYRRGLGGGNLYEVKLKR